MTVHYLKSHLPCSCCETEMPAAPSVLLPNGKPVIPQHYLQFEQNLRSLQEILADVETMPEFLLFADEDSNGLYMQVGMVGRENYDRSHEVRQQKLVYGRKWRIDTNTPTSEIIQTAFLAVKKAREHEVREMFTLREQSSRKISAPFSTHQDLPLLAGNAELVYAEQDNSLDANREDEENVILETINQWLTRCHFGERRIELVDVLYRKNGFIFDFQLSAAPKVRQQEGELPEYDNLTFSLVVNDFSISRLLHKLMEYFIQLSDATVAENFWYKGFARFSQNIDPERIAILSIASRPYARDMENITFAHEFKKLNYQTDADRVPKLGQGLLADRNRARIQSYKDLLGHLPVDLFSQPANQQQDFRY